MLYKEKYIGHNGLSNRYVVLEPDLFHLLEAARNKGQLAELKGAHSEFYQYLKENAFIVADDFDELQACIDRYRAIDFDKTRYELHINPTMNCNFKCWYCYETHIKKSRLNTETQNHIAKFVRELLYKKPDIKDFQLNWFGGEPLLYFNNAVLPIMKRIYAITQEKKVELSTYFTSNGLLIDQNVIDSCQAYGVTGFQITLDGHRERHNRVRFISQSKGSYDKIRDNIKRLVRNEIKVNVRINCDRETLNGLEKIADDFFDMTAADRDYLTFDFHKIW